MKEVVDTDAKPLIGRHIPILDGVRGVAIILVIMCHVNWATGGPFTTGPVSGPVAMVFGWGWVGVDLFFVLSGFLITGILFDAKGCHGFFCNFYVRRALRIMPLYFGFLLFLIALNRLHCPDVPWISLDWLATFVTYTYNFRVAITGHGLHGMHHFWSLAVEEHFYLLWPIAVWALDRRGLMRLCVAIAVVSLLLRIGLVLSGARPLAAFFITPCRLDGLLAGAWVALAWRDQGDWTLLRRYAGPVAFGSGGLLLGIALGQRHFIPNADPSRTLAAVDGSLVITLGIAALAVFFASLIVLALNAAPRSWLRRAFECQALRSIGVYSYAIYIFHALILLLTVESAQPLPHLPQYLANPLFSIWILVASFVTAWLSYHLFERHFLQLKRLFEYRRPGTRYSGSLATAPQHSNA
ncbi:MAG: acyltransferase [Planctomycetes bacterium]|nr:acyltransferase [Planctomycetota bacterium]